MDTPKSTATNQFDMVLPLEREFDGSCGTTSRRSPRILPVGEVLVLDKIDLPDPRDVVEQDVFGHLVQISHGAQPGKLTEVADQVRLVEKPAGHGNCRPVRFRNIAHQLPRTLKPAHAAIQLRRHADLGRKELDEPPLTEADLPGEVANLHGCVCWLECAERNRYCLVPPR